MGFGATQVLSGATLLSELGIDVSKNWLTYLIKNLGDPVDAQDAATRAYVLARVAERLALAGGTMSGAIAMGTSKITGLGTPTADYDASTKKYVDDSIPVTPSLAVDINSYDTSLDRNYDVVYQNTSGKLRLVTISPYYVVNNTGGNSEAGYKAYVENADPPTILKAKSAMMINQGGSHGTWNPMTFLVPNGWYYLVDAYTVFSGGATGRASGDAWVEYDISIVP